LILGNVILINVFASRPAAGIEGRLFFATDTGASYRDNGSSWDAVATLADFVGDSGSGGTSGLVPAPASGDAAAGKFLKADGTFATPPSGPNFADKETPSGTQDGSNQAFTLAHTPNPADSLILTWQGVVQIEGTDFTISGGTITYSGTNAPESGDLQRAWYRY
jgi:hypothetical protein